MQKNLKYLYISNICSNFAPKKIEIEVSWLRNCEVSKTI